MHMDKELRTGIHKIKRLRESMKRRAEVYSFLGKLDDRGTARTLGALQRAPAPGKKIKKIGFILLLSPEPLTTALGIPMIIAGKYLDKVYNGATISDIGHETKKFANHVSDLKHTMR
jgi:hypothetical protein